ncbi:hypothetical protein GDO81_010562 [Engystomops pustulosus]|uniref:Secreted protein n=1 Tax=Engystomops pustulosus TaxID=76066 RepID=A0AAV7C1T5_ENGPU|nr:hypothetical protein GDO81_010562 [Engystomops pustulosus]
MLDDVTDRIMLTNVSPAMCALALVMCSVSMTDMHRAVRTSCPLGCQARDRPSCYVSGNSNTTQADNSPASWLLEFYTTIWSSSCISVLVSVFL